MNEKKIILIATKETFLVKALEKKLSEARITSVFCPCTVDDINKTWDQANAMVYYLEAHEFVKPEVLLYLKERLTESGRRILVIGDKIDSDSFVKGITPDLVMEVFARPLDIDHFVEAVSTRYTDATAAPSLRKRIMIVDDDTTYLGLVRDWLKEKYTVYMANSGMQAIKALGTQPVDLILLDYQMPITSGPQVLEMLRSDLETISIPVFFLTGKSDKESVMQVLDLKPEGYLLKTIEKDALLAKLDEFFSRK